MAEETAVQETSEVVVNAVPNSDGPSTFSTDQPDDIDVLREQVTKKYGQNRGPDGKFIAKADRPKPVETSSPTEDGSPTAEILADDKNTKGTEAQDKKPVASASNTAEPTKSDSPTFSNREVETAKQFGIARDDLDKMTPAELLGKIGPGHGRIMAKLGHKLQDARATIKNAKTSDQKAGEFDTDFKYESADYDNFDDGEDGISAKHNRHLDLTRSALERLSNLESYISGQADSERAGVVDVFFEGIDAELFPEFGTGKGSTLAEGSPELKARDDLLAEAEALREAYSYRGQDISLEDALDRAVHYLFENNVRAAERRQMGDKVNKRRKGASVRPSNRTANPTNATTKKEERDQLVAAGRASGLIHW